MSAAFGFAGSPSRGASLRQAEVFAGESTTSFGHVDFRPTILPEDTRGNDHAFATLVLCAIGAAAAGRRNRSRRLAKAERSAIGREQETVAATPKPKAGLFSAFWKFLRPHTIRGTVLGSSAMVARVVLESGKTLEWSMFPQVVVGLIALLCGNGYIVGINQIYDVSIDLISKPFLPVAAKELTSAQAWVLATLMAICGMALAYNGFGPLIGNLYTFGLFLGTIYSVPPLRLKQSAVAAALIIATVRGFLLNYGVYYAMRAMLGVPFTWSCPTAFITCFCTCFAIVIAVTKDLPDVEGDVENNIGTFASRFGVGNVASIATTLLLLNYATAIPWALGPAGYAFKPKVFLAGHGVLAALLLRGHGKLRQARYSEGAIQAFYRLIWALFYSEYLLFPFI